MFAKVFVLLLDLSLKIFSLLDNNKSDSIRSPSVWQEIEFSVWVPANIEPNGNILVFLIAHAIPVLAARPGGEVHGAEDGDDELHPGPVIPGLHLEAAAEVTGRRPRPGEVSIDCEQAWVISSSGWADMRRYTDMTIRMWGNYQFLFVQLVSSQWQMTIEDREMCNVYIYKRCPRPDMS